MRSERKIASSIEWVTKTMVFLVSSQISSTSWFISSRVKASSAPNGSSISSTDGLNDERAHDRGALLHAARQLARHACAEAVEADALEQARRSSRGRAAGPLDLEREVDVGVEVAPGQQVGVLEHHADLGARAGDRLAVEQHLAARSGRAARTSTTAAWSCRSRTGRRWRRSRRRGHRGCSDRWRGGRRNRSDRPWWRRAP